MREVPVPQVVHTPRYEDGRGYFEELWKQGTWEIRWKQVNLSFSKEGVVRGLHFRKAKPEWKLVYCVSGEIEDYCVSLESRESKTMLLNPSEPNGFTAGVLIPPGWAHGFRAKKDSLVCYMVSEEYDPSDAFGVSPMDKTLDIPWLYSGGLILSDQDKKWPCLDER